MKNRNMRKVVDGSCIANQLAHDTDYCRRKKKKTRAKKSSDRNENKTHGDDHSFAFKVNCEIYCKNENNDVLSECDLVDTGAAYHIVSDKEKCIRYHENFDPKTHHIELADGSRSNNVARGDASVTV